MIPTNLYSQLANHLWQSTVVAAVACTLATALRKHQARTRYWIWLIASMKFLLPFSLLIAIGNSLASVKPAAMAQPALSSVIERVTQPFPYIQSVNAVKPSVSHITDFLPLLLSALWACGAFAVAFSWWRGWRRIRFAVCAASPVRLSADVPALLTSLAIGPGIFGILRPVLILPDGIMDRLTSAQLDAIVAHEMCHVRRRDNLTFALHMVVETLFWFHPIVWWIRARLVEERERACDESVLQSGRHSENYAEGILNVCRFFVESPQACVSGVSGSDLKRRIIRIMTEEVGRKLDLRRKLLVGIAGLAVVAVPIGFGFTHTVPTYAQSEQDETTVNLPKFDVASIRPAATKDGMREMMLTPDGTTIRGVPVQMLLRAAFGVEDDRILGAPSWVKSNRFDIEAKVSPQDAPKLDKLDGENRLAMLIPLLAERFNLKYHHETRELPMYALVVAKGGPKLTVSKAEPAPTPDDLGKIGSRPKGIDKRGWMRMMPGHIESQDTTIPMLTHALSPPLGHSVVDKTGLTGRYDYTLQWTPENVPPSMPGAEGGPESADAENDAVAASLFTAIQEQLGLKLESQKGPVDVIVVDHIDRPSPN